MLCYIVLDLVLYYYLFEDLFLILFWEILILVWIWYLMNGMEFFKFKKKNEKNYNNDNVYFIYSLLY